MRRREFTAGLGSAAAWPVVARAQQRERTRHIAMLFNTAESDRVRKAELSALVQRLKELNWDDGRNARLDIRWAAGNLDAAHKYAAELVAFMPDPVFTDTSFLVAVLQQATRTVPIVFAGVIDPVGAGLVESLPRPGGNTTGILAFEYAISAKWLELLKEIAPRVTRGDSSRSHQCRWNRSVCRDSGSGIDRD
jgi:putative ABC transport system substrate-binding protein